MARVLLVTPTGHSVGLTSVALGLIRACDLAGQRVAFAKPLAQPGGSQIGRDHSTSLVGLTAGLRPPPPIPVETLEHHLATGRSQELLEEVVARIAPLHHQAEVIVVEGLVQSSGFLFDHEINDLLARSLDADVVLVAAAGDRHPEAIAEELAIHRRAARDRAERIVGCVINRCPTVVGGDLPATAGRLPANLPLVVEPEWERSCQQAVVEAGLRLVGCIPQSPLSSAPRVTDVCSAMGARWLNQGRAEERRMRSYAIGAMGLTTISQRIRNGHLLITPGDRHDVLLIAAYAELAGTKPAGLLLTGGIEPPPELLTFVHDALQSGLPLMVADDDTLEVGKHLLEEMWAIAPDDRERAELTANTVAQHLDLEWLDQLRAVNRPRRLTPPAFRHRLIERARAANKRIVLPEGEEPRTLTAAIICHNRGIAHPVLLGDPERIASVARSEGLELPATLEVIDPSTAMADHVEPMLELRRAKGLTRSAAEAALADSVVLGTMMLAQGQVDGLVSGAVHTTAHTIRPALQLIKTAPGCGLVSSIFFMCLPDQVLVYGDCAVNPDPDAEQLADIALQSAASAEAFGIEPRVAMISYSTGASGAGSDVEKVARATALARERRGDLPIDGPLQYDAAVMPDVAHSKAPGSTVAGRATVLVFPDLNTGNTTYKAVQRSAQVVSIGPMLQGLAKPVNDLSRGALVEDIVYTIALTAIQAAAGERRAFAGEAHGQLADGSALVVRPLRGDDEERLKAFHDLLSDETVRTRYHRHFPAQARKDPDRIRKIVSADQVDEIVIGAFAADGGELVAVGRLNVDQRGVSGETAMVVADSWQNRGAGRLVKQVLIEAARSRNLRCLRSVFDPRNRPAIELARSMGYRMERPNEDELVGTLDL